MPVLVGLLDARAVPERYAQLGPLPARERRHHEHVDLVRDEGLKVFAEPRVAEYAGDFVGDGQPLCILFYRLLLRWRPGWFWLPRRQLRDDAAITETYK